MNEIPLCNHLGKWRGLRGTTQGKPGACRIIVRNHQVLDPKRFSLIRAESQVTARMEERAGTAASHDAQRGVQHDNPNSPIPSSESTERLGKAGPVA